MTDSPPPTAQKLVVVILDQPELVDDLITGFLDVDVRNATVLESRGMGQIIQQEMPVFAGLASLFPESTGNRIVMAVVPEDRVEPIEGVLREIVGRLDRPDSAVCFTLAVETVTGIEN